MIWHPVAPILTGHVAGKQFEDSDTAYIMSLVGMRFFSGLGLPLLVLLGVIAMLWWKYIRQWARRIMSVLALFLLLCMPQHLFAYYEKADYTEAYTILPNESAFWIPDVGANKTNQVHFESEEYLKANKVALKRFIVPHTKLSGSGAFFDFYVPAGRLIIVDRTPYSREWVAASHRGTSKKDESFPCQSQEGLNITVGVSIGASVLEDHAAKYLFRFGVKPAAGERTDPKTIFTSVYYSRTLVCREIASRRFDDVNAEANVIMTTVTGQAQTYFAAMGITLDFPGGRTPLRSIPMSKKL